MKIEKKMTGDVLYINDNYKEKAAELFKIIEERRTTEKYIIAISGESGSGKSVLSHCLAIEYKKIGIKAKILHTDDYYKILPELRNQWRQKHGRNSIGYSEYDWEILNENIDSFRKGTVADMPSVDLITNQVDRLITDFSTIKILILDGLYAIKCKDVDFRVYIDIAYEDIVLAQKHRDKETMSPLREMILEKEHEMVAALRNFADFIL